MYRPEGLGGDKTSMQELLEAEVPKLDAEIVVLLQPTVPFRKAKQIRTAVNILSKNDTYDSLITAERVPEKYNPAQVIIKTPSGLRMATGGQISQRKRRRQEYPEAWIPDGSVYAFRTHNLEHGSFYGDKVMIMENEPSINIDNPEDWELAEQWILSQKSEKTS